MTSSLKTNSYNIDAWGITLCFMFIVALTFFPDLVLAQTTTTSTGTGTGTVDEAAVAKSTGALSDTICNIISALQGPVARAVAACGIIFLGFSLFMGKISWGTALSLGIGLGAIFGAKSLVGLMNSIDNKDACAT